jgi:iron complex transport system substrate-binding protein
MRQLAVLAVAMILMMATAGSLRAEEPATLRDDLGRAVTLALPAKRVVVFNRYNVEFVRAVAGSGAIVGIEAEVAKAHAYWPGLATTTIVGQGQQSANYEAIIALKPDLVIFPRNSDWEKASQILAPFGIPVVVVTGWDVLKHEENIDLLGRIFGRPDQAAKLNGFYRHIRDLLTERLKDVPRKTVYVEEVQDGKTVLKGSGWHDMIELAGGINVFGDIQIAGQPAARGNVQAFEVDPEEVLARRPDLIVKLQPNQYESHSPAFSAQVLTRLAARPGFAELPAVKSGQVYHMSYYLAGGCSKVIGALQIAKWLYPERFADIDPGEVMRIWLEEFQGVPYPGGYWVSLAGIGR